MKRANPHWYFAVLAVALLLPGVRALTWAAPRPHVLEPADVEAGKTLFTRAWKANDPLSPQGDGLGPVFNANSCLACHGEPTPGGASDRRFNVTMYTLLPMRQGEPVKQGVVHARATAPRFQETLEKVTPGLPAIAQPKLVRMQVGGREGVGFDFTIPTNVVLSQRNTPALYGAKWIDELPDRVLVAEEKRQRLQWGLAPASGEQYPVGRALRGPDGRVGKFGWKAQSPSLLEFVQAACANELGLGNPASAQPAPLGVTSYVPPGLDLTTEQCVQMTTYIAALPRPAEPALSAGAAAGKALFLKVGCGHCHTPSLGSVEGIYSDLLLHRMGLDLQGGGFYYGEALPVVSAASLPMADEWRTPPLWGVADTAPYMHDGRAGTFEEAIAMHGGQGARAARAFARLSEAERGQVVAFLKSLRAP